MLGNLKEFISVVQDGLSSNNNLRQTLQEVQKVTNIFRDKQKSLNENKVNYAAGGALLENFQEQWSELHQNAEENAKAAEDVDQIILDIHAKTKSQLQKATDFAHNVVHLPELTATVAQCMDSLKNVQILLKEVEEELVDFEDIVERSKMEKWKLDHHYQLTLYKEKKMTQLEEIRNNLAKENIKKGTEKEKQLLAELQNKRESSAIAFQNDIAKYLSSGNIPSGSPLPPQIPLEQIQLDEDRTDLEKFLED